MPPRQTQWSGKNLDGRWLALMMIAAYWVSLIVILGTSGKQQYLGALKSRGVPPCTFPFVDLQSVPAAAETVRAGGNPWIANPADPLQRKFDYPRWVLYSSYLGLNRNTVMIFGVVLGVTTLGCIFYTLGRISLIDGFIAGCFLNSPAVMMGLERGNTDLFIYCLLALALALRKILPAATMVILLASILKIFPAFSLLALTASSSLKKRFWLFAAAAMLLIYFISNIKELTLISLATPQSVLLSYGSIVFLVYLHDLQHLPAQNPGYFSTILKLKELLVGDIALMTIAGLTMWKGPRLDSSISADEKELFAFRMGSGIYLGTFALGTNFDYRTIFLIFCLPLLFRLRRVANPIRYWSWAALSLTLGYVTWNLFGNEGSYNRIACKQALSWGFVASLLGILFATFSRNVRNEDPTKTNEG